MRIDLTLCCVYLFFSLANRCFGENMPVAAIIQPNRAPLTALETDFKNPKYEHKSSGSDFANSYASSRFITPNGDGRNDTFIFRFYNPKDSGVTGKIFTLSGIQVAEMRLISASPLNFYYDLEWGPDSGGIKTQGGVYLYQIEAENSVYTGTVVVIR